MVPWNLSPLSGARGPAAGAINATVLSLLLSSSAFLLLPVFFGLSFRNAQHDHSIGGFI